MTELEYVKSAVADEMGAKDIAQETPGKNVASLGAQLTNKREQLGWSVAEVASHLKLAPRQIDAIEKDNYAALPTMVVTRGFIRSYAKLLGLDSTPLLAMISPTAATPPVADATLSQLSAPFSESRYRLMEPNKVTYKWFVAGALLLLLLAVGIRLDVLSTLQDALQTSTDKTTVSSTPAGNSEPSVALPPPSSATAQLADSTTASVVPPATDVSVESGAGTDVTPISNTTGNQLSMIFRQDSWVDIRGADNSVLISRLVRAGSTESFELSQPVSITIGNLAGVDVTLRGEPVDLKAVSKTNVARLNLK